MQMMMMLRGNQMWSCLVKCLLTMIYKQLKREQFLKFLRLEMMLLLIWLHLLRVQV